MAKYRQKYGHKSQESAWNGIARILPQQYNTVKSIDGVIEQFLTSIGVEVSKDRNINANRVQNRFNEFKKYIS